VDSGIPTTNDPPGKPSCITTLSPVQPVQPEPVQPAAGPADAVKRAGFLILHAPSGANLLLGVNRGPVGLLRVGSKVVNSLDRALQKALSHGMKHCY
jgi:hypothetical protein